MQYKLQKIKSDASFREFFRLFKGKKTSIIVTASKEKFKNLVVLVVLGISDALVQKRCKQYSRN